MCPAGRWERRQLARSFRHSAASIPGRMAGECELRRRLPSELRVRSGVVVIDPPAPESDPGLAQRREQRLVQQTVSQPAVETFDEAVLRRFAWGDVVPFDVAAIREDG